MYGIIVEVPSPEKIAELGVLSWPVWEKEKSSFPWVYDTTEVCYLLEGDVIITPEQGKSVCVGKGDLVTLPAGLSCYWEIINDVKKHYFFA